MMMEFAEYCRQLEAYLCQKNGGHLIRIVGPAFERVCGWAEQGVPLKIARSGIDRYCERQQSRGTRRRPVRIEFCESDILALFDDWRRAVGIGVVSGAAERSRKESLSTHIDRVITRLIARRSARSPEFEAVVERVLSALDPLASAARQARGDARTTILDRLATLDDELIAAATADLDQQSAARLRQEADEDLAGFASRISADARAEAVRAAYERLVRESLALPTIRYV